LIPKFIFGASGNIKNSLHIIDDRKVLYIAGHNVVIYDQDEK